MAKPSIRFIQPGDIEAIAAGLCTPDRRWLDTLFAGKADVPALVADAVARSSHVWVFAHARPLALFGVVPYSERVLPGVGQPWMLCTDETFLHPRAMLKEGRRYVAEMCKTYTVLTNHVDARNYALRNWLERLGFQFSDTTPIGEYQVPAWRFTLRSQREVSPPTPEWRH